MLAHYTIDFFGGLKVRAGADHTIVRFRTQKTAALLAYLAYHRGKAQPREKIAGVFWGSEESAAGRASLSTALSSLRGQLEPPGVPRGSVLICDPSRIYLAEYVETDLATFETLLDRARRATDKGEAAGLREKSLRLFQGDFLPEMYDDWVLDARAQLTERKAQVLGQLADYYLSTGDHGSAAQFAKNSIALNPDGSSLTPQLKALAQGSEVQTTAGQSTQSIASAPLAAAIGKTRSVSSPALLPPQTRFFGRGCELQQLHSLLSDPGTRLLTLTGPGGIGKSRVALMAARDIQAYRPEMRICYAPFTDVAGPDPMRSALRRALQISSEDRSEESSDAALVEALLRQPHPMLLVIDGAEQVAEPLGDLLTFLLPRVPHLTCLVTSRQRLLCDSEEEVAIGPLPVPPTAVLPDDLRDCDMNALRENWPSLALFADRARATLTDFSLNIGNIEAITALVRRLEGIPLSLELAAARVQAFTPAQILAHLDQRFEVLQDRRKRTNAAQESGFSRHLSLRETIAWSFDLLPPTRRAIIRRLSVFRGGWTVDAAAALLPSNLFDHAHTDRQSLHLLATGEELAQLCDASLLRVVDDCDPSGEEGRRFLVLDTIREFADEDMEPTERAAACAAHANHFLALTEEAEPHLDSAESETWLAYLASEHENLLAALDWSAQSTTSEEVRLGLRMTTGLYRYWLVRGYLREGRRYFQHFLNHPCADTWNASEKAVARNRAGVLAMTQGDSEVASAYYRETLELRRALNDKRGIATVLGNLAILASSQNRFEEAHEWNAESLQLWRDLDDKKYIAIVLANLGALATDMNRQDDAQRYLIESIAINLELNNTRTAALSTLNLGESALKHGDLTLARDAFLQGLSLLQPTQDVQGCAYALLSLGVLAQENGQGRHAQRLIETAIAAYRAFGIPIPEFLSQKIGILTLPEAQRFISAQQGNTEASVHALRLHAKMVLEDWESSIRSSEESVRLRLVG